jgi:hypothetical protein
MITKMVVVVVVVTFLRTAALSTIEPAILINIVRFFEISLTDTLLKNKTWNYNTIHGNSNVGYSTV